MPITTENGTGRRKAAVARVYLSSGKGKIKINGRDFLLDLDAYPEPESNAPQARTSGAMMKAYKALMQGIRGGVHSCVQII